MTDVHVPEIIKKFVLENSKMESVSMMRSLCDESFLQDVGCHPSELENQEDPDFISDCSMSSSDATLQSLQSFPYDYTSLSTESHDYMMQPTPCAQDVNNNNHHHNNNEYEHQYEYPAYYGDPRYTHAHNASLYTADTNRSMYTQGCDYQQVRAETYRDIPDSYDSDCSVELSSDIITHSNMYSSMPVNHDYPNGVRLPAFDDIFKTNPRQSKGNRGRPVTYRRPGSNFVDSDGSEIDDDENHPTLKYTSPKVRRGAKNILLWKFLLEELVSKNATHVQWVNRKEGTFKFVDTAECSKLWGMKKKKDDMNFEKLSRGIRHYYRDGLMSRMDGTRLVYKFNWDRVPKSFRKIARDT